MMRLWMIKRGQGLYPADDESLAEFEGIPFDKSLRVEVTQPRNIKAHRLYFALCQRIGAGIGKDTDWVDRAFRVQTGHYDVFSYGGKERLVLRSIAFHNMDNIQFSSFMERCIQAAYAEWRVDPATLEDLLAPQAAQKRQ